MTEPHPLRCETCKNYHFRPNDDWCGLEIAYCGDDPLSIGLCEQIAKRGCASHSAATTSAEQVLDENNWNPEIDGYCCQKSVVDQIAELYELLGNREFNNGNRKNSQIYYGVMALMKELKTNSNIIQKEIVELRAERERG